MTHGLSVPGDFETCSNEVLIQGSLSLADYARVLWVLGDESTSDETFSAFEQDLVRAYVQQGGRLLVSGSEIAYDLDRSAGPTQADRDFLHEYLKTAYVSDDANEYTVLGGMSTPLAGLTFRYGVVGEGSPYEEDWPDVLGTWGGSQGVLLYNSGGTGGIAGVAFQGTFPGGAAPGTVVTLGFPIETIVSAPQRDSLMGRIFTLFGGVTSVALEGDEPRHPVTFGLRQNFPNPFNPSTTIRYVVEVAGHVRLHVYDALGRTVATLVDRKQDPGEYTLEWRAERVASGVYYCRLSSGSRNMTISMVLVR